MSAAGLTPSWLTVFIDFPPSEFAVGKDFWRTATGYRLSDSRGENDQFATLLPPSGDAYVRVQRLEEGSTRLHLDVHVADPWEAAVVAEELGAELIDENHHSYVVLRSPAGFVFCLVTPDGTVVPDAAHWPTAHSSRITQLCLDVPVADYPAEVLFWQSLLGGQWRVADGEDALAARVAAPQAVSLRLQPARFAQDTTGHLHLTSDDRTAEVSRLVAAGAVQRVERPTWTVLEAPGGMALCVVEAGSIHHGCDQ